MRLDHRQWGSGSLVPPGHDPGGFFFLGGQCQRQSAFWSLCESRLYLIDPTAQIAQIHYFSALAHHLEKSRPGTVTRHTRYLDAIGACGIITHLGVFKPKDIRHHSPMCEVHLRRHEQKETDVAIASAIVEAAATRRCSAVALVSGDTDLVPALQTAHRINPGLKRYCFFPPYRSNRAFDACTDGHFKIAPTQLPRHRLPDTVVGAAGRMIAKPAGW
jgi:NYN domain